MSLQKDAADTKQTMCSAITTDSSVAIAREEDSWESKESVVLAPTAMLLLWQCEGEGRGATAVTRKTIWNIVALSNYRLERDCLCLSNAVGKLREEFWPFWAAWR